MDAEMYFHVEAYTEDLVRNGVPRVEAMRRAQMEFGGIERAKEECRDVRGVNLLNSIVQDIRFGLRLLRKSPGFTAVSVVTLALGIGANTAIFSFADVIIRRPISLPQLDQLVGVTEIVTSSEDNGISAANFRDLRAQCHSLGDLAAYRSISAALTGIGEPEKLNGVAVTANFFPTIGVQPKLGRGFLQEEEESGKDRVLILSDAFWRQRFGGRQDVLGQSISLDGETYLVVGVMPPKFSFPLGRNAFWKPLPIGSAERESRTDLNLNAVGLLAPETRLNQARAELEALWKRLALQYPRQNMGRSLRVTTLRDQVVLDYNRQFGFLLVGVAGFVLLIASANIGNLHLARTARRVREVAVRSAMGATRYRIAMQFLTESLLIAIIGGLLGILVANWGVSLLRATLPAQVEEICDLNNLRVNGAAIVFGLAATLATGLIAGIAPAWHQTKADIQTLLREGGARVLSGRKHLRNVFLVSEVALALVLLVGAGLMIRGFSSLLHADRAMAPDSLLTFHLNLPNQFADPLRAQSFYEQFLHRLNALPGVQSAALVSGLPYSYYDESVTIKLPGQTGSDTELPVVMQEAASPDYFRTLHLDLHYGRNFDSRDDLGAPAVAIVSESMAQRLWPDQNPLGKTLEVKGDRPVQIAVVGVVGDTRHEIFDRSFRSILYLPMQQAPRQSVDFVLRTTVAPVQLLSGVRSELHGLEPIVPVEIPETMEQKIAGQTSGLRYVAFLMVFFGVLAVILAVLGIYGVVTQLVNERRREIGIRMALGARSLDVLADILRSSLLLIAIGLAIGIAMSLVLAKVIASLIFGVEAWDFAAFTFVTVLLTAVALFTNYIPARRATKIDPVRVLREE
jgi:putative ABC transport system permease protein